MVTSIFSTLIISLLRANIMNLFVETIHDYLKGSQTIYQLHVNNTLMNLNQIRLKNFLLNCFCVKMDVGSKHIHDTCLVSRRRQ